jgi:hypothetical protein
MFVKINTRIRKIKMNELPIECPICSGSITVTRFVCSECDTTIEGRFAGGPFSQLNSEQLNFVETFVRCEGKITRMEREIGLSYPTIRNRLHDVIRVLGYEPGAADEPAGLSDGERQSILEDLDAGMIDAEEAMRLLRGNQ